MLKICKFLNNWFSQLQNKCLSPAFVPRNIGDLSVSVSAHTESLSSAPQDLHCLDLRQGNTTKTPPPLAHLNSDTHSHQWYGQCASKHQSNKRFWETEREKLFEMDVKKKKKSGIFFNASLIEAEPCSCLSMSCGSRICQSRGLAHLPGQLPTAKARLSIMTSFIRSLKNLQIHWISLKIPPT